METGARGRSRSASRGEAMPGLYRAGHPDGGRSGAGGAGPGPDPGRGRDRRLERRPCQRLFPLRLIEARSTSAQGSASTRPGARLPAAALQGYLLGGLQPSRCMSGTRTATDRVRSYYTSFEGASIPYIERRRSEAESDSSRERFAGFMRRKLPCCPGLPTGRGSSRSRSRSPWTASPSPMSSAPSPIGELAKLLPQPGAVRPGHADRRSRILKEVNARLGVPAGRGPGLPVPGPGVRHAGRAGRRSLDPAGHPDQVAGLVGVLYVLDEPSIGLHPAG